MACLGRYIEFVITEEEIPTDSSGSPSQHSDTVNLFTLMMATQRNNKKLPATFPELKPNHKIQLKNDILKWLEKNELGWSPDACEQQGNIFIKTLTETLWNLDGHAETLKNRGCGIPDMFEGFTGYNKPGKSKHRKRPHTNLEYQKIVELSQELFQLCGSSYLKRVEWKSVYESLLRLADNLRRYATYLQHQTVSSQATHAKKVLQADVDEWEVYQANIFIDSSTKRARYKLLHEALLHAQPYQPIFVNEYAPTDRRRRNEYVNKLVFPCKTIRYSYTGQQSHLHFVWKMNSADSETQRQQNNDNCKEKLKKEFPTFHTRAMKRDFIQHFGRATGVKSGILREAYRCS